MLTTKEEVFTIMEIAEEQVNYFLTTGDKLSKEKRKYYTTIYHLLAPLKLCIRDKEVVKMEKWFIKQGEKLSGYLIDL